ncbi:MAG TPA: CAP domain-containing protein [Planctomycetota bacterium]|nr:CAP domain-containing protein [Planctomycetota bacterium]
MFTRVPLMGVLLLGVFWLSEHSHAADTLLIPPVPAVSQPDASSAPSAASRAPTQQWDAGDPTAAEQHVLEIINRARANPTAEGTRLGIDIKEGLTASEQALVGVRPPLAMNKALLAAARAHSQDMWTRSFFAHNNPDGKSPFTRMTDAGYSWTLAGENIATGSAHTPAQLEDLLMIDAGVPGRGHRINLLDIRSGSFFREVGIGVFDGASPNGMGFKNFLTQDFGTQSVGPFVVGVVYNDANKNGFYDIGEGLAGVNVSPDTGTHFAVTSTSGGYAFPVATSGSITITASGGPLTSAVTQTVALAGSNVKVDFTPTGVVPGGGTPGGGTPGGGTPGGGTFTSKSKTDTDGDGFPDEMEVAMGTSPTSATSTPLGGSAAGAVQILNVLKLQVKLNFSKTGADQISVSGSLPVPANFVVAGQTVVVDVAGVVKTFTLDLKGKAGLGTPDTFSLKVRSSKGVVAAQTSAFKAMFKTGDFAATVADEGLLSADVKDASRTVPVLIFFNGQMFSTDRPVLYTAKTGKTGRTK